MDHISNSSPSSSSLSDSMLRSHSARTTSFSSSSASLSSSTNSSVMTGKPSFLSGSSRSLSATATISSSISTLPSSVVITSDGIGISGVGTNGIRSGIGIVGGGAGGSGNSENLPPRTLARVARDVRDLVKSPPEGVRLVLDGDTGMPGSLSEIVAEIEGPEQTPYHTHYFQLKLILSSDFPSTPPRGYFLTKIYHPNVDPNTGAICVNTLKKDWTPSTSLSHVLTVIRCLLIVPFPESSLNDEAGKSFMDSYEEYAKRARLLAGVHGLKRWTSDPAYGSDASLGEGRGYGAGKKGEEDNVDENAAGDDMEGPAASSPSSTALFTSRGASNNDNHVKLGNNGNLSNIVRSVSNNASNCKISLDKKNKKKSLKRL